jgi:hypothetical protein
LTKSSDEKSDNGAEAAEDYEVGYCKPPKWTRWQKGQSGNPSGRKKRRPPENAAEMLQDLLDEKVTVTDGSGRRKKMSRLNALLMNQLNKAFQNPRAFDQVMKLLTDLNKTSASQGYSGVLVVPQQLSVEDWEVVAEENQRKHRNPASHYLEPGKPDLSGPWNDLPGRAERVLAERTRGVEKSEDKED